MKAFDTNVVVRIVVEDDEAQGRLAEAAWRDALAKGGIFLPKVVVVETAWVLRSSYRFDSAAVASTLRRLLNVEGVNAEDESEVREALARFEQGNADLSDYLILESAREADALPVRTFDRRFSREDGVEIVDGKSG